MSTIPKKFCFILMPFDSEFDDIYQYGIKQSCFEAGAYCERVDEQIFNESILERIYNQISKADVIIADMTNRNPNVFYEVGYAHAIGKTTILLTKNSEDIPFDLKHYPHIIYNNKISKLKGELIPRLKMCIENDSSISPNMDIDLFLGDKSLNLKNIEFKTKKNEYPNPTLTLYNNSINTFNSNEYRIGIITDKNYVNIYKIINRNQYPSDIIKLPDGRFLYMLPDIKDILYPYSYMSFEILLSPKIIYKTGTSQIGSIYKEDQEIIIRLFTKSGTSDFFLLIKQEKELTKLKIDN